MEFLKELQKFEIKFTGGFAIALVLYGLFKTIEYATKLINYLER